MPSDARTTEALRSLQGARQAFLSAVATAADAARVLLVAQDGATGNGTARAARELGPFAQGRVDLARFATVFSGAGALPPSALDVIQRASDLLVETISAGNDLFVTQVPANGDLRATVEAALARAGRAFGAARVAELARTGAYVPETHAALLESYGPASWSRAERELAPPLVVVTSGAALRQAGGLAEYLVGAQKIVLVVQGAAPPAALVRLITPGVFVLQAADAAALQALAATAAPAVAALVGPEAAAFVHDPAGGAHLANRLTLVAAPAESKTAAGAGYSRAQQADELAQLQALVAAVQAVPAPPIPAEATEAAEPADMLAAWLLKQANLADVA